MKLNFPNREVKMKCVRITKHQEWGQCQILIPIQAIKAIEFDPQLNYIKIFYLDKFVDGHVDCNSFYYHMFFNCIEQESNYSFSLWEHLEDSPDRIESQAESKE